MTRHVDVNPPELAPAVGFSHAVVSEGGRTIWLAGQTGLDAEGAVVAGGLVAQFDAAASNLVGALRAAGGTADDLVSMQIFVTDVPAYRRELAELGAVWRRHFGRRYPAAALLGVSRLFDDEAMVELMGVAVVP